MRDSLFFFARSIIIRIAIEDRGGKNEMIDIHCHVLWGVDDASQDRETAKKMLQIAVEDGIEAI